MVFLNIDTKNYNEIYKNNKTRIQILNELIERSPNNKVFILYYMEGCGPCNKTRPEWEKIKNIFKKYHTTNDVAIVEIDHVLSGKIKNEKAEPNSFPTIRYITNKGANVENYEDSTVVNKDRSIDSFVEWINIKTKGNQDGGKKALQNKKKMFKGGKWSRKYKRSINCKKPRGFSQKQYCKYSRRR